MHKFISVATMAALGAAIAISMGAPYDLAKEHMRIHSTDAHEVFKAAAASEMMTAALEGPPPVAGMKFVIPGSPKILDFT